MSAYVIDASAALCWCFDDERPRNADALLAKIASEGACVPGHWRLELANILVQSERRKRISQSDAGAFMDLWESLDIDSEPESIHLLWREIAALARAEKLSAYDAAYLELALRRQAILVTKDTDLIAAAKRNKVPVMDVSV
ncbi:MAG: PIN domain-containing protein [Alphaproteobacteria bacterium]|nr:PIN domain-containing protein [Alphaproteobacteria bacterium]